MHGVVTFCTVELPALEGNGVSGFPCFSKGEDCSCSSFACVASDKNLVLSQCFMVYHGEAIPADYQLLDCVEGVLMDICPDGEVIVEFFASQGCENFLWISVKANSGSVQLCLHPL